MKQSIKKKWKTIAISITALVTLTLVIVFLYTVGFRITYNSDIITDWDAVSGCAAWAGTLVSLVAVLVSVMAIFYAIQVPQKIAKEQAKIDLFDKRYAAFQLFEKCVILREHIENKEKPVNYTSEFLFMLDELQNKCVESSTVYKKIMNLEFVLHQMEFLFPQMTEEDVRNLYLKLEKFLVSVIKNENIEQKANDYANTMRAFEEKYSNEIWHCLTIENIN